MHKSPTQHRANPQVSSQTHIRYGQTNLCLDTASIDTPKRVSNRPTSPGTNFWTSGLLTTVLFNKYTYPKKVLLPNFAKRKPNDKLCINVGLNIKYHLNRNVCRISNISIASSADLFTDIAEQITFCKVDGIHG